jgi:hypothetical protein
VVTLHVLRDQVRTVLVDCTETGEELLTHADIVEKAGGHRDWLDLFARWKDDTLTKLRSVYVGDEIPFEFDAVTMSGEHSTPYFTFPYRRSALERGLRVLCDLEERLPMAIEPEVTGSDVSLAPSLARGGPYGARPTAELAAAAEDHFLEHKETLRFDVRTKQPNPMLEDAAMDRVCGFWNAEGGTLLIGVEDRTGRVTGLGRDLKLVSDVDELVNRVSQRLRNDVPSIAPFVRVTSDPVGAELVLRMEVPAGDRPQFRNDRLLVRINNTTQELKGQAQLDYIRSRFGRA